MLCSSYIESGWYWYYYAHENKTLLKKSHFLCTKPIWLQCRKKFDIMEQCTPESPNTRYRFKLTTIVTIFLHLLKKHSNGISRLCIIWDLTGKPFSKLSLSDKDKQPYKDQLCLFRALAMYLHGHKKLDAHKYQLFR